MSNFYNCYKGFIVGLCMLALLACGGGTTDNNSSASLLKGTVAVGNAIEAQITIADSEGKTYKTRSDVNGKYSIDMLGAFGPFMIKVKPTDTSVSILYSYAVGPGIANVTQFTSLGLILATNGDLATIFDNWQANASNISRSDIDNAVSIINANLATELEAAGQTPENFDFFTVDFNADGTSIDAFLDNYKINFNYNAGSYTLTDASGTQVSLNESIDVSNYYIGALFALQTNTSWVMTMSLATNGGQPTPVFTDFPINIDNIPLSEAAFLEDMWDNIGTQVNDTYSDGSTGVTLTVSNYVPTYNVSGGGEIGTKITAAMSFAYSITGSIQGQNISQSLTYEWQFIYERIN